jgi:hypothetical protein
MNRRGLSLAVLVGAVLVGCGGTRATPSEEALGRVSEALVTCTATCLDGPDVSCTGTTCSATQGSHVTCDDVTTACAPPPTACTAGPACENFTGRACAPRERAECCAPDGSTVNCFCGLGTWRCLY